MEWDGVGWRERLGFTSGDYKCGTRGCGKWEAMVKKRRVAYRKKLEKAKRLQYAGQYETNTDGRHAAKQNILHHCSA